jgi:hypothetical protein
MKKLLLILALVSSFARAETWFEMPNKGGGKIVLLMNKCNNTSDGRVVIAHVPDGTNATGCWTYVAEMVLVVWDTGSIRTSTFDARNFIVRESK